MLSKTFSLKPKAVQDLEAIFNYSYQEFGLKKAERYIKDIDRVFHMLSGSPGIARSCNRIRPGLKAFPIASHIIFFRLVEDGILVIRVLHQSMDYSRHIDN
ncbi:type II toxin-antitoxin system RelE/ParE family toxin [Xenorhabdus stockiae]|uniref:type II toxin-antitoxin system RelE/ParE family toxin n=1 Tax=Xenorhabdus stockiae TaxID=351614 RepID=UPI0040641F86